MGVRDVAADIYHRIVEGRDDPRPIVNKPLRGRTFRCADCGQSKSASAKRQVTRGDNPRAEVCVPCSKVTT